MLADGVYYLSYINRSLSVSGILCCPNSFPNLREESPFGLQCALSDWALKLSDFPFCILVFKIKFWNIEIRGNSGDLEGPGNHSLHSLES